MPRPAAAKPDDSCSVLVVSCDRYQDLWKPFFALFARYWPDCPFPVYLGANFASFDNPSVTTLQAGNDTNWSSSFRRFLEQIPSDYVLLLLEDFFLDRLVDTAAVQTQLHKLHELGGHTMRLFPNPGPNRAGVIEKKAPYRVSLQAAIWHKSKLMQLVRDGESAWEFEWNGTERSRADAEGYYSVARPLLHYQHVVERGEWFWSAARRYRQEPIGCDLSARPVMHPAKALKKMVTNAGRKLGTRLRTL